MMKQAALQTDIINVLLLWLGNDNREKYKNLRKESGD